MTRAREHVSSTEKLWRHIFLAGRPQKLNK
jgi:hypothetical protein